MGYALVYGFETQVQHGILSNQLKEKTVVLIVLDIDDWSFLIDTDQYQGVLTHQVTTIWMLLKMMEHVIMIYDPVIGCDGNV